MASKRPRPGLEGIRVLLMSMMSILPGTMASLGVFGAKVFFSKVVGGDFVDFAGENVEIRERFHDPFGSLGRAEEVDQYHVLLRDLKQNAVPSVLIGAA